MVDLKNGSTSPEGETGSGGTDQGTPQGVSVGDKTYTAEDVKSLIDNQAAATQKAQEMADITTAIDRYGTDPKTFLQQADGAFSVMSDLIASGVIDERGQVVEKEIPRPTQPAAETVESQMLSRNQQGGNPASQQTTESISQDAIAKLVSEKIDAALQPITGAIGELDKTQTNMLRSTLGNQIKSKFPSLNEDDISNVFATAMQDNSKDLFGHAEIRAEHRKGRTAEDRVRYAKEFGVDLDKFDENKLWEQGPGGGAAAIFKDKRISFKGGKDSVTPKEAATAFLKRQHGG